MRNFGQVSNALWEIWRNEHLQRTAIVTRQFKQVRGLVQFARQRSPWYQQHYRHLPADLAALPLLPPVTKSELMAHFDEWVTDPAVTRTGIEAFLAKKTLVGQLYLDRYAVWSTSGVTGKPGIFVHDAHAMGVYSALIAVRGYRWLTPGRLWKLLRDGGRYAMIVATNEHFTLTDYMERVRGFSPLLAQRIRLFSVLTPLSELVQALNTFQPVVLVGYPSVMQLLAQEQLAGRLHITPMLVSTGGECLAAATRAQIAVAFGCMVRDNYGASEFMHMAFECKYNQLHLNTDWVILEPVDKEYQPMSSGQVSHTSLLTNLANRVQPLIRYDLGDSITIKPDPCPCGSPFPAIQVEGRRDDILYMQAAGSTTIPILPLALSTVVEETPGVGCFQVIQTAPATLTVRLEVKVGADSSQVWETTIRRLRDYLLTQGVPSVQLERATDPLRPDRVSGKLRQVWSELHRKDE